VLTSIDIPNTSKGSSSAPASSFGSLLGSFETELNTTDPLSKKGKRRRREQEKSEPSQSSSQPTDVAEPTINAPSTVPAVVSKPVASVPVIPTTSTDAMDEDDVMVAALKRVEERSSQPAPTQKATKVIADDVIEDWRGMLKAKATSNESASNSQTADGSSQLLQDELLMYWIDATEDKFNSPGTIYLFGMVRFFT
jgi:hypothetical protein